MSVARSRVCTQDDYFFFFFFSFSLKTIEYEQGELFPLRIFQRRKSIESLPIAYWHTSKIWLSGDVSFRRISRPNRQVQHCKITCLIKLTLSYRPSKWMRNQSKRNSPEKKNHRMKFNGNKQIRYRKRFDVVRIVMMKEWKWAREDHRNYWWTISSYDYRKIVEEHCEHNERYSIVDRKTDENPWDCEILYQALKLSKTYFGSNWLLKDDDGFSLFENERTN